MNGENEEFVFQQEPHDNAIGCGARILLETISGLLLRYYWITIKFLIAIRHQYQHKDKNN